MTALFVQPADRAARRSRRSRYTTIRDATPYPPPPVVIPAVHPRGAKVGGLLRYLFGPGRREEHVNARVVAAWDGAGPLSALQPPQRAGGWHDVRALTE